VSENGNSNRQKKEQELLQRLLRFFMPQEAADEAAKSILHKLGSIADLCEMNTQMSRDLLASVEGIPEDAFLLLENLGGIVRQNAFSYADSLQILSAHAACEYLVAKTLMEKREMAFFFALDEEFRVMGTHVLSIGVVDAATFKPTLLLDAGLRLKAKYVLLGHNHPGGGTLSFSDVDATKTAIPILGRAGMPLVDHVIVSRGKGSSIRASDKIEDAIWMKHGQKLPARDAWLQKGEKWLAKISFE